MVRWSLILLVILAVVAPAAAQYVAPRTVIREAYDVGYREGSRQGEFDAQRGRGINFDRDPIYRDGLRGYAPRFGSRDLYREDFRRGFVDGYRTSYARLLAPTPPPPPPRAGIRQGAPVPLYHPPPPPPPPSGTIRPQQPYSLYQQPPVSGGYVPQFAPGAYQEPAYARGYSDGFRQGLNDGRGRHAYNPINHGDYREGDGGYYGSYGPRDAYRDNYRSGYRTGYEEGYRSGTGRR